jgi:hypothetical protein
MSKPGGDCHVATKWHSVAMELTAVRPRTPAVAVVDPRAASAAPVTSRGGTIKQSPDLPPPRNQRDHCHHGKPQANDHYGNTRDPRRDI